MPTPTIIERVKQVHDELGTVQPELAKAPEVDAVKQQLDTVILEPEHKPHYASLADKLRNAYVSIEGDHPLLAKSMATLANELAKVGL